MKSVLDFRHLEGPHAASCEKGRFQSILTQCAPPLLHRIRIWKSADTAALESRYPLERCCAISILYLVSTLVYGPLYHLAITDIRITPDMACRLPHELKKADQTFREIRDVYYGAADNVFTPGESGCFIGPRICTWHKQPDASIQVFWRLRHRLLSRSKAKVGSHKNLRSGTLASSCCIISKILIHVFIFTLLNVTFALRWIAYSIISGDKKKHCQFDWRS